MAELGVTYVWLTGVLRQATLTDYSAFGMLADDPDVVKDRTGSRSMRYATTTTYAPTTRKFSSSGCKRSMRSSIALTRHGCA